MESKHNFRFWQFATAGALLGAAVILGSPVRATAQAPAAQAPPSAPSQSGGPGRPGNRPSRPPSGKPGGPPPGRPTGGRPGRPTIQPVPGPRPTPAPGRPGYRPPRPGPGRPPGGPPPPYAWRPGDRDRMRRYYGRNFGYINRGRRPIFTIGGFIPFGDRGYFRPVPPGLYGYLPPPPPGYVMGYFDGYVVIYDPVSYSVLNVMDLLD
jgi:hypothetical protein